MTERVSLVGPATPYRGGMAHFTCVLAREFGKSNKVQVVNFKRLYPSFLFPGKTQFDESEQQFDVPSERIIDSLNPISFWSAARAIRRFGPDLIVFQWWHPFFAVAYSVILFFLGGTLRRRVVFLCHNVLPHERSIVDTVLIRLGFAQVDRFLVQSTEDSNNLLGLKRGARVEMHPHPIYDTFRSDTWTRKSAREALGVDGRVILFFGLIRPYKGLHLLIDAFAALRDDMDATLFIVGEFYEKREPYIEQIAGHDLGGRIRLVDHYVPNEEVEKYFKACDLVVLPYLSATQSGITQVAFAFDQPVVVTRVGGLPDVVEDGETGFVVPPGDSAALADAIRRFFEGDTPRRMGEAVARAKMRFSWGRAVEVLVGLVEEDAT